MGASVAVGKGSAVGAGVDSGCTVQSGVDSGWTVGCVCPQEVD